MDPKINIDGQNARKSRSTIIARRSGVGVISIVGGLAALYFGTDFRSSANQSSGTVTSLRPAPTFTEEEKIFLQRVKDTTAESDSIPAILSEVNNHFRTSNNSDSSKENAAAAFVTEYALRTTLSNENLSNANTVIQSWLDMGGTLTPELEKFRSAELSGTINFYVTDTDVSVLTSLPKKGSSNPPLTYSFKLFDSSTSAREEIPYKMPSKLPTIYAGLSNQSFPAVLPTGPNAEITIEYTFQTQKNSFVYEQRFLRQELSNGTYNWIMNISPLGEAFVQAVSDGIDDYKTKELVRKAQLQDSQQQVTPPQKVPDAKELIGTSFPVINLVEAESSRTNILKAGVFNLDGKVQVVSIWARWCTPCVQELPLLSAMQEKYGSFISVSSLALSDEPENVIGLSDFSQTYTQQFGVLGPGTAKQLRAYSIPLTFIVVKNNEGVPIIFDVLLGFDPKSLENGIAKAIKSVE